MFMVGSPGFRESADRSPPEGSRGRIPVGVWGQNLSFRFTKRRKAVLALCAVHIHAFMFPVCVVHFKTKWRILASGLCLSAHFLLSATSVCPMTQTSLHPPTP